MKPNTRVFWNDRQARGGRNVERNGLAFHTNTRTPISTVSVQTDTGELLCIALEHVLRRIAPAKPNYK